MPRDRNHNNYNKNRKRKYSAASRYIFIPLNQYGCPKNEPKFLKTSLIFLTSISLITVHSSYLIILQLCLVVWHRKPAKQSQNFCWSDIALSYNFIKVLILVHVPVSPKKLWVLHWSNIVISFVNIKNFTIWKLMVKQES